MTAERYSMTGIVAHTPVLGGEERSVATRATPCQARSPARGPQAREVSARG